MDNTLSHALGPVELARLRDALLGVADVLADLLDDSPFDRRRAVAGHRSWCLSSQHTEGRCVSDAVDVSDVLSCWLIDDGSGTRVVVDVGHGGVELTVSEAWDLTSGVQHLVDQDQGA
ncbi:MAG: hypothetical protein ACRCYU_18850 [Nocardioides sp.]